MCLCYGCVLNGLWHLTKLPKPSQTPSCATPCARGALPQVPPLKKTWQQPQRFLIVYGSTRSISPSSAVSFSLPLSRCRDSYFYGRVMGIFTQAIHLSFTKWLALPLVYHATCSCITRHRRDVFPRLRLACVLAHFRVSLRTFTFHCISSCIIAFHHASSHFITHHCIPSPIIRERLSMSDHLIGMSYSLPHGCNKHCSVITCYYILSVHFLPIPSASDVILSSI
jgi:hypothetical protein